MCRERFPNKKKIEIKIKREIEKGLYITASRSQRHLTKPFRRYGIEKSCQEKLLIVDGWHS
jgi:tRNA(Ile2) C34 agmatinyltransferase TiaS